MGFRERNSLEGEWKEGEGTEGTNNSEEVFCLLKETVLSGEEEIAVLAGDPSGRTGNVEMQAADKHFCCIVRQQYF